MIPQYFIPKSKESQKLYKLEEELFLKIRECTEELCKLLNLNQTDNYYQTCIPLELYTILDHYGYANNNLYNKIQEIGEKFK